MFLSYQLNVLFQNENRRRWGGGVILKEKNKCPYLLREFVSSIFYYILKNSS
jgi:hypothetical protein